MNIGIIGYANASGHGAVIYSLKEMLPEMCQFIIPNRVKDRVAWHKSHEKDYKAQESILSPNAPQVYSIPPVEEFEAWLDKVSLDCIFLLECPFNWDFLPVLKDRGIKIIMMPLLDAYPLRAYKHLEMIDAWISPTVFVYRYLKERVSQPVYHLAVPIDIKRYAFKKRGEFEPVTFLHNIGYGGSGARKSTILVVKAFKELEKEIKGVKLILNSQKPVNIGEPTKGIIYKIENVEKPESLYTKGDVYVYPSTAEGIGLQILEAMSCGFPVITTNYPPMNEYVINSDFLIDVDLSRNPKEPNERPKIVYEDLVKAMRYAASYDVKDASVRNRKYIEKTCSYDVLRPKYRHVFEKVRNTK